MGKEKSNNTDKQLVVVKPPQSEEVKFNEHEKKKK